MYLSFLFYSKNSRFKYDLFCTQRECRMVIVNLYMIARQTNRTLIKKSTMDGQRRKNKEKCFKIQFFYFEILKKKIFLAYLLKIYCFWIVKKCWKPYVSNTFLFPIISYQTTTGNYNTSNNCPTNVPLSQLGNSSFKPPKL